MFFHPLMPQDHKPSLDLEESRDLIPNIRTYRHLPLQIKDIFSIVFQNCRQKYGIAVKVFLSRFQCKDLSYLFFFFCTCAPFACIAYVISMKQKKLTMFFSVALGLQFILYNIHDLNQAHDVQTFGRSISIHYNTERYVMRTSGSVAFTKMKLILKMKSVRKCTQRHHFLKILENDYFRKLRLI